MSCDTLTCRTGEEGKNRYYRTTVLLGQQELPTHHTTTVLETDLARNTAVAAVTVVSTTPTKSKIKILCYSQR